MGQSITLNDEPYTVAGVMPAGAEHPGNSYHALAYGADVDVWWPFTFEGKPSERGNHFIEGIGRLRPGVTLAQASSELNGIMADLDRTYPGEKGWHVNVIPLAREVVGQNRLLLLMLLGAVGMVLLIACANAANLLLARATARRRELAVRMALGARRGRLIRQLLTESLCVAFLGGVLGLAMAWASLRALLSLLPEGFPRAGEIHVNGAVFAFTLAMTTAAGVLFGLMPALQVSRSDPRQALHEGGSDGDRRTATAAAAERAGGGRGEPGVRPADWGGADAAQLSESAASEFRVPAGACADGEPLAAGKPVQDGAPRGPFLHELTNELRVLPGVKSAGAGTDLPYTGYDENLGGFDIEGKQPPPHSQFHARFHVATSIIFMRWGFRC